MTTRGEGGGIGGRKGEREYVGGRGRREKAEGGGEYQRRRDLEGGRVNDIQFGDKGHLCNMP